jgi:hypothetical protein
MTIGIHQMTEKDHTGTTQKPEESKFEAHIVYSEAEPSNEVKKEMEKLKETLENFLNLR